MMGSAQGYAEKIRSLCARQDVGGKIAKYLDEQSKYAALTFNRGWADNPNVVTDFDLLALNFLGLRIEPLGYRQLLEHKGELEACLERIDPATRLWEVEDEGHPGYQAANKAWQVIMNLYGFGYVGASKLLARKRPHLVPILDQWVGQFYDHDTEEYWLPLAEALRAAGIREMIARLRPTHLSDDDLSILRTLDIAIWMTEVRE
jgi:hypothetical protein